MTFLLFAARTIQIKRELNAKNYELSLITDKVNEAVKKVSDQQTAITDMKNNFQNYSSVFSNLGQSAALQALQSQKPELFSNGSLTQEGAAAYSMAMTQGTNAGNALARAAQSIFDNTIAAQQKAELSRLQAQQSALETRKNGLETEVQLLKEEYQSYKSQAKEGVQDAVPHFGLA